MAALLLFAVILIGIVGTAATALVVAVGRAAARAERRRGEALYAWAAANGWQLREGDVPAPWRQRLAHLRSFRVRRLVYGAVGGLPVLAADCHYTAHGTDGQGNSQSTDVSLSVFVARLPGVWPDIEVRGRRLGSRLLRALGRSSRVEVGHPLFDQRFTVEAADPRAAHAVLSPALVDAHLRGLVPPWSLHGGELLVAEMGRLTPEDVLPGAQRVAWLAGLLIHRG
jgi:hypothetical protein